MNKHSGRSRLQSFLLMEFMYQSSIGVEGRGREAYALQIQENVGAV